MYNVHIVKDNNFLFLKSYFSSSTIAQNVPSPHKWWFLFGHIYKKTSNFIDI